MNYRNKKEIVMEKIMLAVMRFCENYAKSY